MTVGPSKKDQDRIYFMRFKRETIRLALSDHVSNRIGSSAIHQTQGSIERFLRILARKAQENLERENRIRRDAGLSSRRTLQAVDIERAFEDLGVNTDS